MGHCIEILVADNEKEIFADACDLWTMKKVHVTTETYRF